MQNGDWDGMSDRKFEEQTGDKPAFKSAFGETFKMIPMSEALAGAKYVSWAEIDRDLSSEELGKEIAQLMSDDLPIRIEEAPAWNAGHEGMPSDRDVWAYVYAHDAEDDIELARGRADCLDFKLAHDEWEYRGIKDVVCWVDTDERPAFSIEVVKVAVSALVDLERTGQGHVAEDWLHREALRAVVAGHPDAQAIAAAALESRAVKFTRYYS